MKIALHNHHLQPWFEYHPYIQSLIKRNEVCGIFISDRSFLNLCKSVKNKTLYKFINEAKENNLEIFYDINKLNSEYDVLLDLNFFTSKLHTSLPDSLKKFNGIKIFHIGDYFGYHKATEIHSRLKEIDVTALLGYCMHDNYCNFFREYYSSYIGKVWGVPFGYSERFKKYKEFGSRIDKAISLGSLYKLSNSQFKKKFLFEAISFFKDEQWFHRFREKLFSQREEISKYIECGIPDPFSNNNQRLDLVKAFNDFKFFVSCESIFNFPTAKVYEGTASGSILLASEHPVYDEIGFKNNQNCILFEHENIKDLTNKIDFYLNEDREILEQIAINSNAFTHEYFNSNTISNYILDICRKYMKNKVHEPEPYIQAIKK